MTKFKLDDVVKITGNASGSNNSVGDIGIITEVDESVPDYRVTVEGKENNASWTNEEELELYKSVD